MNSSALQGPPTSDPHFQPVPAHFDPRAGQEEAFRRLLIQDWIRVIDVDVYFTFDPESGQVLGAAPRTANRQMTHFARRELPGTQKDHLVVTPKGPIQKRAICSDQLGLEFRTPGFDGRGKDSYTFRFNTFQAIGDNPFSSGTRFPRIAWWFPPDPEGPHLEFSPIQEKSFIGPDLTPVDTCIALDQPRQRKDPGQALKDRRGAANLERSASSKNEKADGMVEFGVGQEHFAHGGFANARARLERRVGLDLEVDVWCRVKQRPILARHTYREGGVEAAARRRGPQSHAPAGLTGAIPLGI